MVQAFALQDVRAIGRNDDHENPHRSTNFKHLVDAVSVTSVAYHHDRVLGRQWCEMILQPCRAC